VVNKKYRYIVSPRRLSYTLKDKEGGKEGKGKEGERKGINTEI
jgi:hypothetical protein